MAMVIPGIRCKSIHIAFLDNHGTLEQYYQHGHDGYR
jgi:hypothetical protein